MGRTYSVIWLLCLSMCHGSPLPDSAQAEGVDCEKPEPLLNGGVTVLSGSQNHGSVIQYHCNEPFYSLPGSANVSFTCEADGKWKSSQTDVIPTCTPVCGQPTTLISAYGRIIGGSEAPDNTIPWQVMLSIDGNRGGGMMIADRWIMTAAHVLKQHGRAASNETVRIYMGLNRFKPLEQTPLYPASIHIHPGYNNPNYEDFDNDIALLKLHDSVTFTSSVMPVCLPAEGATYTPGTIGLVSGFGVSNIDNIQILTNKLNYVNLPVVEQETCSESIAEVRKTKTGVPGLTDNMFCAGLPEGGKDSCQGDNGGPLALREDGRFWAAGIVSWGVDCGKKGVYGVYTKVTNYVDWIKNTMQGN